MAAGLEAALRAWALALAWALGLSLGPRLVNAGQVPLIAWSTHSSLWPPLSQAAEGRVVGAEQLEALLTPALRQGPPTVLLFLQEKLSVEDFTAYGGVYGNKPDSAFPNLEGALGAAASSLVLPAVAGGAAEALPHSLGRVLGAAPLRLDGASLQQLRLDSPLPSLLLVRLPHTAGSSLMAPKEVLTSNDEILGQVLSALKEEQVPYTALFTALQPSHVLQRAAAAPAMGLGRALLGQEEMGGLEEEVPPPLRWPPSGPPRILLWGRNISVAFREQQLDLTPRTFGKEATVDLGGSSWDPQEARLILRYPDVFGESLNITLVLRQSWFPVSGRSWAWLDEVGLSLGQGPLATFVGQGVSAPTPLGWRCGELVAPGPFLVAKGSSDPARHWRLLFTDVQLQAFNVSGVEFGGATDCAAFFSPGVWMGLLTGGLLLVGLFYGGGLLLHLRTMDRFDDPRGPPLPVPLTE